MDNAVKTGRTVGGWRGAAVILIALALGGAAVGQERGKKPAPPGEKLVYTLTLAATDEPDARRKTVSCVTSGFKFVDLFVPAAAPIARRTTPNKRLPVAALHTGSQMICRGDWTDATRSTFRASAVLVLDPLPKAELD